MRCEAYELHMTYKQYVDMWYNERLKDDYMVQKYNRAGIYTIKVNDKLVYVGKSQDMLFRIAQHMGSIFYDMKAHKYKVLYDAYRREDCVISFDVIYKSKYKDKERIFADIGEKEAYYINKYLPPLNYQIPNLDDYKHFKVNKKAQVITLDEILQH